ncbi:c-type cytochrome [Hydrogenimonas sp.]
MTALLLVSALAAEEFSLEDQKRYLSALENIMQKIDRARLAEMGKELFVRKCAFCHGKDGKGRGGFAADLTRRISKERAKLNIQKGARNFVESFPGGMPPMVPDDERAEVLADFVAKGLPAGHAGEVLYEKAHCARCHGKDGTGIRYRAPNIRHFDLPTVAAILRNGKFGIIGRMPAYPALAPYQVTMLAEYIMSLENPNGNER